MIKCEEEITVAQESSQGHQAPESKKDVCTVAQVPTSDRLDIEGLQRELMAKKKLLAMTELSALPDGGLRIKDQIRDIESAMCNLKLQPPTETVSADTELKVKELSKRPETCPSVPDFYALTNTTAERKMMLATVIEKLYRSLDTKPKEDDEEIPPDGLTVSLMPHQRQALAWLMWRECQQPSGGILADDMGLGKTLTMIALILKSEQISIKEKNEDRTKEMAKVTLVVCPASLLHQWENEIKQRCEPGFLQVHLYHGSRRHISDKNMSESGVILTTYEIVRNELVSSKYVMECDSPLRRYKFRRVILDEGHVIKNPKSDVSIAVCCLSAKYFWVVTGTPIHNRVTDMFPLLRFLRCSPFDEVKVWKYWVENNRDHGQERLATIVSCILLRRTKGQTALDGRPLLNLPTRTVHDIELKLSKEENEVYSILFDSSKAFFLDYLKTTKNSYSESNSSRAPTKPLLVTNTVSGGGGGMARILVSLLRLQQCCCHLSLLREAVKVSETSTVGGDFEADILAPFQKLTLEEPNSVTVTLVDKQGNLGSAFDKSYASTKITTLLKELVGLKEQSTTENRIVKSVVVSQWTSILDVVAFHLEKSQISFCQIRGNVKVQDRKKAVEEFNNPLTESRVMLLSLKAGGVGLNLCGGSHLFFLDIHWNPALEIQAADRIHRMGQTRDVHIHSETIETKITILQQRKLELAKKIVTSNTSLNKIRLSLEDMKMLFKVD